MPVAWSLGQYRLGAGGRRVGRLGVPPNAAQIPAQGLYEELYRDA